MAMLINDEIVLISDSQQPSIHQEEKKIKRRENQRQKNHKKYMRNQQLSTLPVFTSDHPYEITFINYMTPLFTVFHLIELANATSIFAIDTETDDTSKQPALIQIQFVHSNNGQIEEMINSTTATTIVIFEMCQLPSTKIHVYSRIQQLINVIFHCSKTFLVWGNGHQELSLFTIYPLIKPIPMTSLHFINVQKQFKHWYNHTYPHDQECYMTLLNYIADDPQCTCSHRPYKNFNDQWRLQLAISILYKQFLDKSITRNDWGQGLDLRLYQNRKFGVLNYNVKSCLTAQQEQIRLKLVKYAVDDCLALTKLASKIGNYLVSIELEIMS